MANFNDQHLTSDDFDDLKNVAGAYDDGTTPGAAGIGRPRLARQNLLGPTLSYDVANFPGARGQTGIQRAIDFYRNTPDPAMGPPAPLGAPKVSPSVTPTRVQVNPTLTDLYQQGALRPLSPVSTASAAAPIPRSAPVTGAPATPSTGIAPAGPFASINSGVATGGLANGATSINGRPLGYGQMVNGVRTFSDGTGNTPATMTGAQIAALNNVSRADAGIGGGIASAAFGGTPPIGAFDGSPLTRPAMSAYTNPAVQGALARQYAQSDLLSALNEDPRSEFGTAARNLRINTQGLTGAVSRFGRGGPSPYQEGMSELLGSIQAGSQGAQKFALNQQAADNQRALGAQADSARGALDLLNQRAQTERDILTRQHYAQDPLTGQYTLLSGDTAKPVLNDSGQRFSTGTKPQGLTNEQTSLFNTIYKGTETATKPDPMDPTKIIPLTESDRYQLAMQRATGMSGASPSAATPRDITRTPNLNDFLSAARQQGSKMTDAQLKTAYTQKYGS